MTRKPAATDVAAVEPAAPALAPVSEAESLILMIERAARDPSIDISKMERILEVRQREIERVARVAYVTALAELQSRLPVIQHRGTVTDRMGKPQYTFARWEDINEAIREPLQAHGFSLSFRVGNEGTSVKVTGILTHMQGHSEETSLVLPVDGSGSKNVVQAIGSSVSYGKRYTAQALLNLTTTGEDDDGRAGGGVARPALAKTMSTYQPTQYVDDEATPTPAHGPMPITPERVIMLRDRLVELISGEADIQKFLEVLGVRDLSEITEGPMYVRAHRLLDNKKKQLEEAEKIRQLENAAAVAGELNLEPPF